MRPVTIDCSPEEAKSLAKVAFERSDDFGQYREYEDRIVGRTQVTLLGETAFVIVTFERQETSLEETTVNVASREEFPWRLTRAPERYYSQLTSTISEFEESAPGVAPERLDVETSTEVHTGHLNDHTRMLREQRTLLLLGILLALLLISGLLVLL